MQQAIQGTRASNITLRFLSSVAVVALISACQPGAGGLGQDATRSTPVGDTVQLIERDVEAPDVFQAQDRALWDGRPSLGGVWVAAPDVKDPERVIIRNEDNGKFVIGALFKRERANPGPPLQLSSDAAAALGIIAGAPTTIDVVALRREEMPDPTVAPAATAPVAVADAADEGVAEDQIIQADAIPPMPEVTPEQDDAIARAVAAVDRVEGEGAAVAHTATEVASIAPAAVDAAETQADRPRRGNFFSRLFGGNRNRQADPAALTDTDTAAEFDTAALPPEAPTATSGAAPAISSSSLDAPSAAPAQSLPVSPLDKAYIQIGIFSVEANARNTATSLSNAGVLPTVLEQESRGRKFWRVIVGPSMSAGDRAAVLRKAKGLGFTDAYAVSG